MADNNRPGSLTSIDISPGTIVEKLKKELGYKLEDDLLRIKGRQTLRNKINLFSLIEPNEKLVIIPDTEMGTQQLSPFLYFLGDSYIRIF